MTIPFFKTLCKEMPDDLRGGLLRELKYKYGGKGQKVVHAGCLLLLFGKTIFIRRN